MSMTSAGYYIGALDIVSIGGSASKPLYSFGLTQPVKKPICYYQARQGEYANAAIVAGGTFELNGYKSHNHNIASDWAEVVNYVKGHDYDGTGSLELGFYNIVWPDGSIYPRGHSIVFLRYEVVDNQVRLYAYDNNLPNKEVYFYQDSSGNVCEEPDLLRWGGVESISLSDVNTYFDAVKDFDAKRVLYMDNDDAFIPGCSYSYMKVGDSAGQPVMFEIPEGMNKVTIVPKKDNASFTYLDEEYSFGKVTDTTCGAFVLATSDKGAASSSAAFTIYEADSADQGAADGATAVVGGATYKVISAASGTVYYQKAPKSKKSVTVPATVKINGKAYKVVGIAKGAFKGAKAKTVIIKSAALTKKSVKKCFKGAKKLKTVKVKVYKSKAKNKKLVKKYKKFFAKKVSGKKVNVK